MWGFGFFYYQLQFNHLLSNLIGISCASFWNYTINNLWTWSTAKHNKTILLKDGQCVKVQWRKRGLNVNTLISCSILAIIFSYS